jgi:uncharacterized membrane protein
MGKSSYPLSNPARALLILLWGGLLCLIVAAPVLASLPGCEDVSALIYIVFAPVCHQHAERSFFLLGRALAVCHRCVGIYLGLFLGSIIPFDSRSLLAPPFKRRLWVLGATAPLFLDAALPYLGIWKNSAPSRVVSGFIFGIMLTWLLVPGVEELLDGAPWKKPHFATSQIKGGIS